MTDSPSSTGSAQDARPLIVIPSRFSESASALRFRADVTARKLAAAVYAAGGEPVMIHPVAPVGDDVPADRRIDPERGFDALPKEFIDEVAARVAFADGVLLPGGGDVSPVWTGDAMHDTHYDVDVEQDAFDFALARVVLEQGIPTLAICRAMQLLNVALGGTLHFDMDDEIGVPAHRHRVEDAQVDASSRLAKVLGESTIKASCYHHQCLKDVAPGWQIVARSEDGITEAVELVDGPHGGSVVAVQWHPEDTHDTDPTQLRLFEDLVTRAREARAATAPASRA